MITIVDYGVGNIGALLNMFDYLGVDAQASGDAITIENAKQLVLPGVGAYDTAINALELCSLTQPLNRAVLERRVPVLGVCLGMQLMARGSSEGRQAGLGWIDADVKRIKAPPGSSLKVPHVGWSEVNPSRPSKLFRPDAGDRFYFVHSYHVVCDRTSDVLATVQYGSPLCCAIQKENIWGVQFHPEKSHRYGMRLLSAFANLGAS
jgi:glutamine amidotransferase